jgi:UDP-glucose 4-epimerase
MRAVVTGGAGFVGSHMVDRLLEDGWDVTVFDNMSTGSISNLSNSLGSDRLKVERADIRDQEAVMDALLGQDVVFHFAATQDVRNSLRDHQFDFENNIQGTLNLLEAAYRNDVPHFIFAQTTALYGENDGSLMPESFVGVQTNLYGATKLAAGALAEAYTQFSPMKLWTFRFGRVLGAREKKGAIWDFISKLKRDPTRLEILGNGKQSRQYVHVSDIVDGILFGYSRSRESVNVFNLSTEETVTIEQLTDVVLETLCLEKIRRIYTSDEPRGYVGDNPKVHLSIEKMKALGWAPKRTARDAIVENTVWAARTQNWPGAIRE